MKHLFGATLLILLVAALVFVFLHTSVSYGETASVSSLFCSTHAHLSLRLVLPAALEEAVGAAKEAWEGLPPAITLLPSLLWESAKETLGSAKEAYEGEICGCVTLG